MAKITLCFTPTMKSRQSKCITVTIDGKTIPRTSQLIDKKILLAEKRDKT